MKLSSKRRLTCITIGISSVLSGVEYGLILPSVWGYLQNRFPGSHPAMLGALLSGHGLGALLGCPLTCWWAWLWPKNWAILLTLNLFSVLGATLYSAALSPWAIFAARFISGIGFGCQSAMVVDISCSLTSQGTGRRALNLLYLCKQVGLLIGPALYLPLRYIHLELAPSYIIDKFSAPGVILAGVFLLQELLFLVFYHSLIALREEERLQEQLTFNYHRFSTADTISMLNEESKIIGNIKRTSSLPHFVWSSVLSTTLEAARAATNPRHRTFHYNGGPQEEEEDEIDHLQSIGNESDVMIESAEQFIMSTSESQSLPTLSPRKKSNVLLNQSDGQTSQKSEHQSLLHMTDKLVSESSVCFESVSRWESLRAFFQELSDEYLRDDTVVLLAIMFTAVTAQKVLETITTLFTKVMFSETDQLNSIIFIIAGVQLLLVGLGAQLIRRLVMDRVLLLLGLLLLSGSFLCLLLCLPRAHPHELIWVPYLIAGGVSCLLASPLLVLCSSSLLINITAFDKQVMTQELSQLMLTLGSILGSLWGGALWGYPQPLLAVPLGIASVITILYILSFKRMISSDTSESSYSACPTVGAHSVPCDHTKSVPT